MQKHLKSSGKLQNHSKEKLALFKSYLVGFLSVLLASRYHAKIQIHDVFAGCETTTWNEDGSAKVAVNKIKELIGKYKPNKPIKLRLNDYDSEYLSTLNEIAKEEKFVEITNMKANSYIEKWNSELRSSSSYDFFFIDPYGYTQISEKNLSILLSSPRCDCLYFLPISHFRRGTQVKSNSLGLNPKALTSLSKSETIAPIVSRFKELSKSEYVYGQILQNADNENIYGLFFISHHILGADKFLSVKVGKQTQSLIKQSILLPIHNKINDIAEVKKRTKKDTIWTNIELYLLGIKLGFHSSEIREWLTNLLIENKIEITDKKQKIIKLNKSNKITGLCIEYKYYKEEENKKGAGVRCRIRFLT